MCGRLNIIDDPFSQYVSEQLGIAFSAKPKAELYPSESIDCVVAGYDTSLFQLPLSWGVKPSWSKKLIINAQAETVQTKPTFAQAYASHRAIVPCSGWFEWKNDEYGTKLKYLFQSQNQDHEFGGACKLLMVLIEWVGRYTSPSNIVLEI
jgi:putative SOS response-associated peptidase YedK